MDPDFVVTAFTGTDVNNAIQRNQPVQYTMSESGAQGQKGLNPISSMLNVCPYQLQTATFVLGLLYCLVSIFSSSCWSAPTVSEQSHLSKFQSKRVLVNFDLSLRTCFVTIS